MSLYKSGNKETWLLTGWEERSRTSDVKEGVNPNQDYADGSSGIQDSLGAEAPSNKNITTTDKSVKGQFIKAAEGPAKPKVYDEQDATGELKLRLTKQYGETIPIYHGGQEAINKPIRREDVLSPLMKALGVPLYKGRIKNKKVAGFYRKIIEEVRTRKASDLEVTAHEIAHLLDDRIPEIKKSYHRNKKHGRELRAISYDQ